MLPASVGVATALLVRARARYATAARAVELLRFPDEPSDPDAFRVGQFNILARTLAAPEHFPHSRPALLAWETRSETLLGQMRDLDADVLCCEELSDYWTFFGPGMERFGYGSCFVKRPSINAGNRSGVFKSDGCGVFYKRDRFELLHVDNCNYQDKHDRVALLAVLRCLRTQRRLAVVNTHLYWNAEKPEVQLAQLETLRAFLADRVDADTPLVLAGDMNNGPHSAVYAALSESFALRSSYDRYKLAAPEHAAEAEAAGLAAGPDAEPAHTTVTSRRAWTIDYVWFSPRTLRACGVLPVPTDAELRAEEGPPGWDGPRGLPNSVQGSDHVPVMAELSFL